MEIDLHFNRSSSSHLNIYKVRIFGTIVFKTLSYEQGMYRWKFVLFLFRKNESRFEVVFEVHEIRVVVDSLHTWQVNVIGERTTAEERLGCEGVLADIKARW